MFICRLTEVLANLEEQNIQLEVRKVPDKSLMYELRMPEKVTYTDMAQEFAK